MLCKYASSPAVARKADRTPYHIWYSCRTLSGTRPVLLIVNTGRATRPCTSGAGCDFDSALTYATMRQRKECTMFFVTNPRRVLLVLHDNICRFRQQNTARKVHLYNYFNKKRTYRPTTNQNGAHGTRSQQPNWSHDLCLLLIAQALVWNSRGQNEYLLIYSFEMNSAFPVTSAFSPFVVAKRYLLQQGV